MKKYILKVSKNYCDYCDRMKRALNDLNVSYVTQLNDGINPTLCREDGTVVFEGIPNYLDLISEVKSESK